MIDVAVRWFDFKPHKHLNVHIGNGIELIAKAAKNGQCYIYCTLGLGIVPYRSLHYKVDVACKKNGVLIIHV